jgi:hypothetical protein
LLLWQAILTCLGELSLICFFFERVAPPGGEDSDQRCGDDRWG